MKRKRKLIPLQVIGYLRDAHNYFKEECLDKRDWANADEAHMMLLKAYHVYTGIKKDYRKKI